jgi:protein SCO1
MTTRPNKENRNSVHHRFSRDLIFFLTIAFVITAGVGMAAQVPQAGAERRVTHRPIESFTLVDQNGAHFDLEKLTSKVVVVAFAYTTCVDVCPLITAALRQTQIGLGKEERTRVQLLTITTDPEIDSPKVLKAYGKRYGAEFDNWAFLTGSSAVLGRVWKNFGVGIKHRGRGLVDHTPLTAIVDEKRLMRFVYVGPSPDPHAVLDDVHSLLKHQS